MSTSGILDADGQPFASEGLAVEELRRHWQEVFTAGTAVNSSFDFYAVYAEGSC